MKLTRLAVFTCDFGRLEFLPALPGHKVFWRPVVAGTPDGLGTARRVGWIDNPVTPKLARFFIRVAVAEDRGLPKYTFADQNQDPPPIENPKS